MNIKEIVEKYKECDSADKLGIISNITTIISAVIAIITSQILTIKYVIEGTALIRISFYIVAMGISILVFFFYIKGIAYLIKEYKSFLVQSATILIATGSLLLFLVIIWSFVITIQ